MKRRSFLVNSSTEIAIEAFKKYTDVINQYWANDKNLKKVTSSKRSPVNEYGTLPVQKCVRKTRSLDCLLAKDKGRIKRSSLGNISGVSVGKLNQQDCRKIFDEIIKTDADKKIINMLEEDCLANLENEYGKKQKRKVNDTNWKNKSSSSEASEAGWSRLTSTKKKIEPKRKKLRQLNISTFSETNNKPQKAKTRKYNFHNKIEVSPIKKGPTVKLDQFEAYLQENLIENVEEKNVTPRRSIRNKTADSVALKIPQNDDAIFNLCTQKLCSEPGDENDDDDVFSLATQPLNQNVIDNIETIEKNSHCDESISEEPQEIIVHAQIHKPPSPKKTPDYENELRSIHKDILKNNNLVQELLTVLSSSKNLFSSISQIEMNKNNLTTLPQCDKNVVNFYNDAVPYLNNLQKLYNDFSVTLKHITENAKSLSGIFGKNSNAMRILFSNTSTLPSTLSINEINLTYSKINQKVNAFVQTDPVVCVECSREVDINNTNSSKRIRTQSLGLDTGTQKKFKMSGLEKYDNDIDIVFLTEFTENREEPKKDVDKLQELLDNYKNKAGKQVKKNDKNDTQDYALKYMQLLEKDYKELNFEKERAQETVNNTIDNLLKDPQLFESLSIENPLNKKLNSQLSKSLFTESEQILNSSPDKELDEEVAMHNSIVDESDNDIFDDDIVESTPQKDPIANRKSEQRIFEDPELLSIAPPPEFQDTQPKTIPDIVSPTPETNHLLNNCIDIQDFDSSHFVNDFSPKNPISLVQKDTLSPLTIVKTVTHVPKTVFASTPKQKSILSYMTSSPQANVSFDDKMDLTPVQVSSITKYQKKTICIACTRLSKEENLLVVELTRKFNLLYSNKFTNEVTHMVVSVDERNRARDHTMKYISAIVNAIWIVSFAWIQECLMYEKLMPEVKNI